MIFFQDRADDIGQVQIDLQVGLGEQVGILSAKGKNAG